MRRTIAFAVAAALVAAVAVFVPTRAHYEGVAVDQNGDVATLQDALEESQQALKKLNEEYEGLVTDQNEHVVVLQDALEELQQALDQANEVADAVLGDIVITLELGGGSAHTLTLYELLDLTLLLVQNLPDACLALNVSEALGAVVYVQTPDTVVLGVAFQGSVLTVQHAVEGLGEVDVVYFDGTGTEFRAPYLVAYTNEALDIARLTPLLEPLPGVYNFTIDGLGVGYVGAESDGVCSFQTFVRGWDAGEGVREYLSVGGYDLAPREQHNDAMFAWWGDLTPEEIATFEADTAHADLAYRSTLSTLGGSGAPVYAKVNGQHVLIGINSAAYLWDEYSRGTEDPIVYLVSMERICRDLAENDVDLCGLND